jgi:hypothetical protein
LILPAYKVLVTPVTTTNIARRLKGFGSRQGTLGRAPSSKRGYGSQSLEIEVRRPAGWDLRVFAVKVFFGNGDFLNVCNF